MNKLLSNSEKKENLKIGELICIPNRPIYWNSGIRKLDKSLKNPLNLKYPIKGRIINIIIDEYISQLQLLYNNDIYGFSLNDTDIIKVNDSEMSII